ncbi:MAG: DUF1700 domain-containing protein [Acidobacteria bacterium]|nr:DUF1700 domain-containing protein [Acidobacteriota bacterium]
MIDAFLSKLRAALRGMPDAEIEDILRELRGHIAEVAEGAGGSVEGAIQSLGDPIDLAKTYRAHNLMAHAECSGSPLVILQGLRNATRTSAGRVAATVLYISGYSIVITLLRVTVHKLFSPSSVGAWYAPGERWPVTLVWDGAAPDGAREVLGWWLIPATLAAGWVLKYAVDRAAQWWIRRTRRSKEGRSV